MPTGGAGSVKLAVAAVPAKVAYHGVHELRLVLRSMVMNHLIHHRGQFTMYLRLNDIPVPGLYGPSADEAS